MRSKTLLWGALLLCGSAPAHSSFDGCYQGFFRTIKTHPGFWESKERNLTELSPEAWEGLTQFAASTCLLQNPDPTVRAPSLRSVYTDAARQWLESGEVPQAYTWTVQLFEASPSYEAQARLLIQTFWNESVAGLDHPDLKKTLETPVPRLNLVRWGGSSLKGSQIRLKLTREPGKLLTALFHELTHVGVGVGALSPKRWVELTLFEEYRARVLTQEFIQTLGLRQPVKGAKALWWEVVNEVQISHPDQLDSITRFLKLNQDPSLSDLEAWATYRD